MKKIIPKISQTMITPEFCIIFSNQILGFGLRVWARKKNNTFCLLHISYAQWECNKKASVRPHRGISTDVQPVALLVDRHRQPGASDPETTARFRLHTSKAYCTPCLDYTVANSHYHCHCHCLASFAIPVWIMIVINVPTFPGGRSVYVRNQRLYTIPTT